MSWTIIPAARWISALGLLALAGCGGGGSSAPKSFTIGGAVNGLVGSLVLQNNGASNLTLSANGTFSFSGTQNEGTTYNVTVLTQPELQACTISGGSGTASTNVSSIAVNCADVAAPVLALAPQPIKTFHLSWSAVTGSTQYKVLEDPTGSAGFTQLGTDVTGGVTQYDHVVTLYQRLNARYKVQACGPTRCIESNTVAVTGTLAAAVGYFKASNAQAGDYFGNAVALSGDGQYLAVGATSEDAGATAGEGDNSEPDSGAVYVFARSGGTWVQQAYLKASNGEGPDRFGVSLAMSRDGSTLAVGANLEASAATGVNGNQNDDSLIGAGAVYVFRRTVDAWAQQAYLKASNPDEDDYFGGSLALSADGATLAIGATGESSSAHGTVGSQADNSARSAGAVYVFVFGSGTWNQVAYIKASNSDEYDAFGMAVALSGNGEYLAVGATGEGSGALGVGGDQSDESANASGAVYVFKRGFLFDWPQQAYIKASVRALGFGRSLSLSMDGSTLAAAGFAGSPYAGVAFVFTRSGTTWSQHSQLLPSVTESNDYFGESMSLSEDGTALAIGAPTEDSAATGVNGDSSDTSAALSGAAYLFTLSGTVWSQQAYFKASNSNASDYFGRHVSLSADGSTLAVSAPYEDSNAIGIGGDQSDNGALSAGAVYLY